MAAQGEKAQDKVFKGSDPICGLALVEEIVAINPTNAQKAKMFGFDEDTEREETEYVGKNENGKEKLMLDIYMRVAGDFGIRKHRFFLENEPIMFEDERDDNKEKFKWVNQVGQICSAETEDELGDWFTEFQKWDDGAKKFVNIGEKKVHRKCLKGEDGLMRFLREALRINYSLPSANLEYNYKKLFKGNVSEILGDLQGELFRKFVIMFQVTTREKEEEDGTKTLQHFEKLWLPNNNFDVPSVPEEAYKHITNGCKFPSGWIKKRWEKYKDTYTNYPPSGHAPLQAVATYQSEEDISASGTTKTKKKASTADDDDEF